MNGSHAPELTDLLKEITEDIAKYVIKEGQPIILIDEYSWYTEVLSLMAKQVNLCDSCILLLENGMEQEAYLLARSQFNNTLWIKYLCEAEEGDNTRFKEFFYQSDRKGLSFFSLPTHPTLNKVVCYKKNSYLSKPAQYFIKLASNYFHQSCQASGKDLKTL